MFSVKQWPPAPPQLPAAATISTLRSMAYCTAALRIAVSNGVPSEMFTIRAPWSVAHTIACAMSLVSPVPVQSSALIGRMRTPNATPLMPAGSRPLAAMIPATCVPCELSSSSLGRHPGVSELTKVAPGSSTPARSGWPRSTPVSIVLTPGSTDPEAA